MKPSTLAIVVLLPTISAGQGNPDTGNSKLWEMRKKVQQRNAQRAGSYLDQMNQSLTDGDAAGAEAALKSAIAQGTMTQPQIDDARSRISTLVSRQQQAAAAAERAKMAAAQAKAAKETEAQLMAAESTSGGPRAASRPLVSDATSSAGAQARPQETEEDRFKRRFKGRDVSFTVVHDDGGGFASSNDLVLKDATTGKKFSVWFTHGLSAGLGGGKSLEGRSVEIRFGNDGAPSSIKNLENGRSFDLDGWKASGYGW